MTTTGKKVLVIVAIVVAVVCFVTGLLIGWFLLDDLMAASETTSNSTVTSAQRTSPEAAEDLMVSAKLMEEIQASHIEQHLRFLSERPHLAGTEGDQRTVDYVKQEFEAMGYEVTLYPYDVLLSYPVEEHFNKVSMLDGRGNAIHTTEPGAKTGSAWDSEVTWPYCMYSPSGKVKGKLIYANYGRPQDFKLLDKKGVDLDQAIVIMRYGKTSRGKKVREAARRGGAAVILYNDPADVNINVTYNVFPATWWLPGDDVEHGNIRTSSGDPATPGYAATEGAYRIPKKQMDLPSIPCHPVGYRDARVLLQNLDGESAPEEWQGKLGIDYMIATGTEGALPVELTVKNTLDTRRVYNVVASLKGATEPERVVLVGNHRDAVAYGALDPGSGTAVMLELARAFAAVTRQGWQPRRTVMFCSWAAEEFGLIGSTEWVEEKRRWLSDHAVAYLNLDTVLQGNYTFDMSATPSLKAAGMRAASKVPDPHDNSTTVLDVWRQRVHDDRSPHQPWIRRPVSDTDLQPFVHLLGVPVTHSRYSFVEEDGVLVYHVRNYPLYHTVYDTMPLAAMMDPNFAVSKAVAAIMAELTRDLADSLILPIQPRDYALDIMMHLKEPMQKAADKFNNSVFYLQSALDDFLKSSQDLQKEIDNQDMLNLFEIQRLNDKLMLFEREFVDHKEGTHLFLTHGSNSKPSIDHPTMSAITQALRAAAFTLSS
ncbi:N-acetylated-alpha-linked acidic dipeptidase 2-like [Littorina saxatilis]|uniref:Uncharacterized protein n=1 Tax=Littorina saxatilis TaxID=31220 RepID=A0AAN9B4W5_9CAEN